MLLALAALPSRVPLIVTHHSDVIRQKILRLAQRPFEHCVYRRATWLLTDSPAYAAGSSLLTNYGAKVRVLPLGIDLAPYLNPSQRVQSQAEKLLAEHGKPLWLCVGRLVYYKGLHTAIEALSRVPGKLLIIGAGPLEQQLKEHARTCGVADRIAWRGQVEEEEMIGAYHAATALWFPSNARSEVFGLVQVEAMASGCPVINTSIPDSGVAWVSRHGETGFTVSVNDPAALAAAANQLVENPGLRKKLGHNGRLRAQSEFDHFLMARRSLDIYQEALRRPPIWASRRRNLAVNF
jgi:rhamnosyl/mannosyltransferase